MSVDGISAILDCPFYLMHFNDFCFSESTKRYYPAEVAICKFSLRNGVKVGDVYHSFINPGNFIGKRSKLFILP